MRVYYAGPLFTSAEREWNVKLVNILRANKLDIWLPQEHEPKEETANSIFHMCKTGIDESDIVLAILDGPDPDSGTSFECGYAYGKGKPVFTIRTDFRNSGDMFDLRFNLMLSQSSTVITVPKEIPTTEEVALAIIKSLENN